MRGPVDFDDLPGNLCAHRDQLGRLDLSRGVDDVTHGASAGRITQIDYIRTRGAACP